MNHQEAREFLKRVFAGVDMELDKYVFLPAPKCSDPPAVSTAPPPFKCDLCSIVNGRERCLEPRPGLGGWLCSLPKGHIGVHAACVTSSPDAADHPRCAWGWAGETTPENPKAAPKSFKVRPWRFEEVPVGALVISYDARRMITFCERNLGVKIGVGSTANYVTFTPEEMLRDFTMADGSPCGLKEEA